MNGQQTHRFSPGAGSDRTFYVSLPCGYDRTAPKKYKLVIVFPGTNISGAAMKTWFGDGWNSRVRGIEKAFDRTAVFVYPDAKWRQFAGWGLAPIQGWLLGPRAAPADGNEDLQFIVHAVRTAVEQAGRERVPADLNVGYDLDMGRAGTLNMTAGITSITNRHGILARNMSGDQGSFDANGQVMRSPWYGAVNGLQSARTSYFYLRYEF